MAKKILIVDDEPDLFKIISFRLIKMGYEILDIVSTGQDALDLLKEKTPDLIILDLLMPRLNGYEVCRQIKSNSRLSHIPVIIFTACNKYDVLQKADEAGADDCLFKI